MITWRDVVGYEGIYEVSDTGLIKSRVNRNERILKKRVGKDNCCKVNLWKDKKDKTWLVHRLVAIAFLPEIDGKNYVNHKDGNRLNNDVSNLEWCNHTENNNHAFDNNLIKTGQGIVLYNKITKESHRFRSKAKASEFLGKNHGFVSRLLTSGKTECGDFIFLEQKSEG